MFLVLKLNIEINRVYLGVGAGGRKVSRWPSECLENDLGLFTNTWFCTFYNLLTWHMKTVREDGTVVFQFYKWELEFWEVRQSWIAEWLRRWESCFESRDTASWDRSPLAQQSSAAQGALRGSSSFLNSILMGVISLPARPGCCSHPDTEIWVGNRANRSSGYKTKAGSFWITS